MRPTHMVRPICFVWPTDSKVIVLWIIVIDRTQILSDSMSGTLWPDHGDKLPSHCR